ncbi:MAG: hypothetical protein OXH76_01900 [Boseongicola sp.]|uniref:Deoxycytidine triphosphate deaminase n=1 Tax=Boseongicola sp. SB0664_bin_43 TaxID=2604844 RepID=A0A6B0Y1K3_9RHOB|nr:hypothetical protein [Boseongicola sp.]MXY33957.1 deoxycytidine triphosphate deaminase [Boseongicola sp. SB0664_bin_43]MYK32790.1 deoxycytidine triphosphate deaminase [Boseongicola sp. SB0670_bin_30]
MAFWSGEKLEEALPELIEPFDPEAIDCAAYTLHVGDEIYVSPDREVASPGRHSKQKLGKGEAFAIPPGQFAFLTTTEEVSVPDDAIAFISIKARMKFGGLVNISGFHVDPGYVGKLIFSVLNAGPKPLHLTQGQKLFLIWYADLDRKAKSRKKHGGGHKSLDSRLVNGISGEILSLQSLSEKQRSLEGDLNRKLERQRSEVVIMRNLLLTLIGLATILVGWMLKDILG